MYSEKNVRQMLAQIEASGGTRLARARRCLNLARKIDRLSSAVTELAFRAHREGDAARSQRLARASAFMLELRDLARGAARDCLCAGKVGFGYQPRKDAWPNWTIAGQSKAWNPADQKASGASR